MKQPDHVAEAERIGADSWELLNFTQLPNRASAKRQIEALRNDQRWQRHKWEETDRAIDELIADIESTPNVGSDASASSPIASTQMDHVAGTRGNE